MRLTLRQLTALVDFADAETDVTFENAFVVLVEEADLMRATRDDGEVCWVSIDGVIHETKPKPPEVDDADGVIE